MLHNHSKTKAVALLVCLTLAVTLTVGSTLALLVTKTGSITNLFQPGEVTTEVEEEFGEAKKNVKIKNTGNTDGWLRAAVVITWQDASGNVYGTPPAAGKYTISYNLSIDGWVKGDDGFYYWTKPVAPGKATGVLINTCTYNKDDAPAGYYLTVEIVGSGLQSKPAAVFTENWGTSSGLKVSGTPDTDGYKLEKKGGA